MVYLDESGIDNYVARSHGWAAQGKKIYGTISGRKFLRESFIAGKCNTKILGPLCFTGTCNSELFNYWIENFLLPALRPGQVIIMDNAAFDKSEKTKKLISQAGCRILFLPPYSPDLNPIETFWANLKRRIRDLLEKHSSFHLAVDNAFLSFDSQLE